MKRYSEFGPEDINGEVIINMKKVFIYLLSVVFLFTAMISFSSCKDEEKGTDVVVNSTTVADGNVETSAPYVTVTDKNGNAVTNSDGNIETELSNVKDNKTENNKKTVNKTKKTYKVKGGTDPYVADPFN